MKQGKAVLVISVLPFLLSAGRKEAVKELAAHGARMVQGYAKRLLPSGNEKIVPHGQVRKNGC